MVSNIKSVLIALTKETGEDEVSSALSYGLSLAHQAGAHATVEACLPQAGAHRPCGGRLRGPPS
jgi:hypothetical protein